MNFAKFLRTPFCRTPLSDCLYVWTLKFTSMSLATMPANMRGYVMTEIYILIHRYKMCDAMSWLLTQQKCIICWQFSNFNFSLKFISTVFWLYIFLYLTLYDGGSYHIETSPLTCRTNQTLAKQKRDPGKGGFLWILWNF